MQSTDTKTMTKAPGTTDFMPPECLADRPVYGLPLDVFSYGGVILYTITRLWPQPSSWVQFDPNTGRRVYLSETQRRQRYLDKMSGGAADLRPLVMSCLDDNPTNRPSVAQASVTIKRVKDVCSQKSSRDGMSPMVWWAEVSDEQQSQVTSSLTTALEELRGEMEVLKTQLRTSNATMKDENKQLRTDNAIIKDENKQLRTDNATMKDEIKQLKTENDMIKDENLQLKARHVDTSRSLHPPPVSSQAIEHNLKVLKESTTPGDLFSGSVNIKWEEGAPLPLGCRNHIAVWLNGLVYVGGGWEHKVGRSYGSPSYNIRCFDPVNKSWRSPINTPYCDFAMTTLNNKLLIAGGYDKRYKIIKITNQILTMDDGQLKNYTKMTTARSQATATGHQGMLIITGGMDNMSNELSSTELFDSNNGQWYICSDLPQPHYWLQSVIVDNILYLLGGINKDGASPAVFTAPLDTLSKHQLNWKTYQDTPRGLSVPVSVHGTHLLIVGGYKKIGDTYTTTFDVYKLNKVSHSWEAIGHIPSARKAAAAVSTADKIIVIGGRNDKDQYTNTVWIGLCEPQ